MTKHTTTAPPAGSTDYDSLRARRQASMTDAEQQVYTTAYREAGWAMDLAELVYTTRTEAGLTQTELAAAMGTSQSAVAAWENGARTPGVEALERLARACGKHLHITIAS
jgi:DNA-binding transcriptional regulator YiaG